MNFWRGVLVALGVELAGGLLLWAVWAIWGAWGLIGAITLVIAVLLAMLISVSEPER